jgi:hypothetical protein
MNKYLIHFNGIGKFIELSTRDTTSAQFAKIQKDFAYECSRGNVVFKDSAADMIRLWPDQEIFGVYYSWGLAGPGGAWFNFIVLPCTTKTQLEKAMNEIRRTRDVVSFSSTRIRRML